MTECYCFGLPCTFSVHIPVYTGGAGCQAEGRKYPTRPGENQGGPGEKGESGSYTCIHIRDGDWSIYVCVCM